MQGQGEGDGGPLGPLGKPLGSPSEAPAPGRALQGPPRGQGLYKALTAPVKGFGRPLGGPWQVPQALGGLLPKPTFVLCV